jgi:DNA-binding IclR family transcriptional regulator
MKDKDSSTRLYSSPAVQQAGHILFCLARNPLPQMSLSDICSCVGVSGSKAFGILKALQELALVKRGKEGKGYALGPGLITLARKVLDDLNPSQLAVPILDRLAKETGSTTALGLIVGDMVYIAARRESTNEIRIVARIGQTRPVTFGAHGKAIAAFLTDEDRERLLNRKDLRFHGSPSKLDRARLKIELDECRRTGFACDFGETVRGINVIAAPLIGHGMAPIGFIEVFFLFSDKRSVTFGPTVARAGKELSRLLGAEIE